MFVAWAVCIPWFCWWKTDLESSLAWLGPMTTASMVLNEVCWLTRRRAKLWEPRTLFLSMWVVPHVNSWRSRRERGVGEGRGLALSMFKSEGAPVSQFVEGLYACTSAVGWCDCFITVEERLTDCDYFLNLPCAQNVATIFFGVRLFVAIWWCWYCIHGTCIW